MEFLSNTFELITDLNHFALLNNIFIYSLKNSYMYTMYFNHITLLLSSNPPQEPPTHIPSNFIFIVIIIDKKIWLSIIKN